MTKKILAVLLALAMVLSLVSVNVFAAEEVETAWTTGTISNETKVGWATAVPSSAIGAGFIEALSKEGATLVIHTDLAGEDFGEWGWSGAFVLQAAEGDWDQTSQLREQLVIDKKETGTDVSISGADVIADLKETISGYETISQWQIVLNTDANDGKSLACETYVVTGAEITVPKASEGEGGTGDTGDDADLEVVWELAAPVGEIGSKTTEQLFGTQHAAFLEAINTEGAVFEITVTNPSESGMMNNIFADGGWNNAYFAAGENKWPANGTFTYQIPAADLMEKAGITEITNMRLQFGIYGDDTVKISLDSAKVLVPKSGDEDGTTVKLEKATWDGGKQGNFQINIPLDDVNAVKDPSTIESFVVELTVTGAVADGKKIDVTKIGSDVAIMDPWTAAGLYISPEADGTLKLEVPAAKIGTSNNWIIQLYIDGENLPSGLDTKEASLTYKDFKITINYKPEPEKCDHEDDYDATEVEGTIEEGVFTPTAPIEDAEYVHVVFDGDVDEGATIVVNYVPEEVNPHIPEGYEVINEINGKELTAAVPSWGGDPDATFARLARESYDLEADDYIYAAVVPADGVDYSAWQVGLNDATNWNGNVGSETGELEVGAYVKDIFGKLADGTPVTVENFTSIWCQIWHAKEGESIKSSTVLIARKDSTPAVNSVKVDAVAPCTLVAVDPTRTIASITVEGATIAKVEVLTKKATKPTNPAIPGLPNVPGLGFGYPIQLGNEYHGFLLADGSMITMPHEFNANGFCTVCGYTVLNNSTPATDVTVDVPTEAPETQEDDTEGDDMNVSDEVETPKEDENPKTGLALAVLPMLAAAAVAVASRKH